MKLLIVDDEDTLRFALSELFSREKYTIIEAENGEAALRKLENESIDIAILDYNLSGRINGMDLLKVIKENYNWIKVIMITAFGSENLAIDAIRSGAYDYIAKPFSNEALLNRVNHIRESLLSSNKSMESDLGYYFSPAMNSIIDKIKTISATDIPILIMGESGTGKELIAKLCHRHSGRTGKFVSVNCSALPPSLIESELFGSEKGAYTGADRRKIGYFELAQDGSIFLDEIGELPFEMQAKLLRVLQEGEIVRIGGGLPVKINSRVIAATNRDLEKEIKQNRFREDLYYRLNVVPVKIPSLKFRKEEIQPLSRMFLKDFNEKYQKNITGFDKELLNAMINYAWPGNIRELKNKIEKAVILCRNEWIQSEDMTLKEDILSDQPEIIQTENREERIISGKSYDCASLPENLVEAKRILIEGFEKDFILFHLNKNEWNVKSTADRIGMHRQDLYKKLKKLGIQKEIKYT